MNYWMKRCVVDIMRRGRSIEVAVRIIICVNCVVVVMIVTSIIATIMNLLNVVVNGYVVVVKVRSVVGTITILLNIVVYILNIISVMHINIRNLSNIRGSIRNRGRQINNAVIFIYIVVWNIIILVGFASIIFRQVTCYV